MEAARKESVEERVRSLASTVVAGLGVEIVGTAVGRRGQRWHVRIDIDRPGPGGVGLEDCERVSRTLEAALDEAAVAGDSYVLDVSSPGLDRPITTDDDIRRNTGRAVVVETREPLGGRRSFRGVLLGADGDALLLREQPDREVRVPRSLIVKAHQEIVFR